MVRQVLLFQSLYLATKEFARQDGVQIISHYRVLSPGVSGTTAESQQVLLSAPGELIVLIFKFDFSLHGVRLQSAALTLSSTPLSAHFKYLGDLELRRDCFKFNILGKLPE